MGGASWVTDAARVSLARKPTETVDRAWIFGGLGLRRSAHVGVVKTCLLDPLVATSGSSSAHQPVATGLCDLWSFDGDRWQLCVSTNILPSTREFCYGCYCACSVAAVARVDHGPVICAITQARRLCSKQRRNALCGAAKILFRHELVRATVLPVFLRTAIPPDSLVIGHLHFHPSVGL